MRRSFLAVLVLAGLLLTSCGPAIVPAANQELPSGETFVVALPRIVVTFDQDGRPGLEGVPIEDISAALGRPIDMSAFSINSGYPMTDWMTAANVQHIELRQTGDGIAMLVNGALMPSLSYGNGALDNVSNLGPLLGPQGGSLATILDRFGPLVQRLGLAIVLKFPMQDGAQAIDYAPADLKLASVSQAAAATTPSAVAKFEIRYDAQGVPSILGISARDLQALGLSAPLALRSDYVAGLQANNIQNTQISARPDGLHMWVNGQAVPTIVWNEETLNNAVDVYAQMNPGVPPSYLNLIRTFVPMLGRTDISVLLHFPAAPGVAEVDARMQ
jgi:hypothetical protein